MSAGWLRFVGLRLAQVVPVLLALLFVSVILQNITPGDPARAIAGPRATNAEIAEVRAELGLDDSVFVQYVRYLEAVIHGDLGESSRGGVPVTTIIGERAEVTVWLLVTGVIMTVLLAAPAAVAMARRPDGRGAWVAAKTLTVALNCPPFWVALILASTVALQTGWFPVGGFGDGFGEHVRAMVLPAFTISLGAAALVARSAAASLRQVLQSDHVVTARSLGVSGPALYRKHVVRNALPPVITMLSFQVAALVLGAVVVEQTFGLPGLGSAMIQAATERDFPVVQGLTLMFGVAIVLTYMLTDFVVAALDPRVRR